MTRTAASAARPKLIPPDVLNVLGRSTCTGAVLRLPEELDRKLYQDVNKVLLALGGKWVRGKKGHVFNSDAAELVDQTILTRSFTNAKQDFGAFYTPLPLAQRMISLAQIEWGMSVLEPSAGSGVLANLARQARGEVTAVEIRREAFLSWKLSSDCMINADFLTYDFDGVKFDRIVMNPPFARRADIHHITRAISLLKPGGRLVAIASAAVKFRDDWLAINFRDLLRIHGGVIEDLPEGTFRESGTAVNTVLIALQVAA